MSSGEFEVGAPFPIVVGLPYVVQKAVAGSGFPSSSSSEVVNFKHSRKRDLVYTSRLEANWRPPRVQTSPSFGWTRALLAVIASDGCWGLRARLTLLLVMLLLFAFALELLFCDPVTKLSKEVPGPAAAPACALFQVDSGTVAMAVSVAVRVVLALTDADGGALESCRLVSVAAAVVVVVVVTVALWEDGAVIQ